MANKSNLVDQIKQIQRSDPEAKQQWWDYCDTNLGGIKDPNRHDVGVLESFLSEYGTGSLGPSNPTASGAKPQKRRPAPTSMEGYGYSQSGYNAWAGCGGCGYAAYPSQWGGMGGPAAGGDTMASMVKTGQRRSQHWKTAWQAYCGLYGNGFNDPARYDEAFLVGFIDYVGQLASGDLGNAPAAGGAEGGAPGGQKRSLSGSMMAQAPPSKRVAGGYTSPATTDFEKSELVERIKSLQRSDPEAKTAWWNFCDEFQGGIKDPNRHDVSTLQKFLAGYE